MAVAIQMVSPVETELVELLSDDDQRIRLEALRALAGLESPQARCAIRERLLDASRVVAEAAEAALQAMSEAIPARDPLPGVVPASGLPLSAQETAP